jgi:hypothetical protein
VTVTVVGQVLDPDGLSWHLTRVDTASVRSRQGTPIVKEASELAPST